MKRIDQLQPGDRVQLRFDGRDETEPATFVKLEGEGDDRLATFSQTQAQSTATGVEPVDYEWDAYRYNGRWAFGTSAQRLSLASVEG